jgi:hypothetical protein
VAGIAGSALLLVLAGSGLGCGTSPAVSADGGADATASEGGDAGAPDTSYDAMIQDVATDGAASCGTDCQMCNGSACQACCVGSSEAGAEDFYNNLWPCACMGNSQCRSACNATSCTALPPPSMRGPTCASCIIAQVNATCSLLYNMDCSAGTKCKTFGSCALACR